MKPHERIIEVMKLLNLNKNSLSSEIGMSSNVTIGRIINEHRTPNQATLKKIVDRFPQINYDWLLTGEGEMLKTEEKPKGHMIPLYDDTSTRGGSDVAANVDGVSAPSDYIDTGDWFRDATAAIRHYGDSMIEYPPGCILALKEVRERQLIIWGKDYVIETNEYRITKRLQSGDNKNSIKAYSSNVETYPDGKLIHEPIPILWSDIRKIYMVLGYVVKKGNGTMVYSSHK